MAKASRSRAEGGVEAIIKPCFCDICPSACHDVPGTLWDSSWLGGSSHDKPNPFNTTCKEGANSPSRSAIAHENASPNLQP